MQPYLRFLTYSIKAKAELWLCFVLSVFYFYYSYNAGTAWFWSILLQIPIIALNYILIRWSLRRISDRLQRAYLRPLAESLVSFLMLSVMLLLLFWQKNYTLLGLGLFFSLWLAIQLYLRRLGSFYAGFLALLLLALSSFSYYLLLWEGQGLLFASHYYQRYKTHKLLYKKNWQKKSSSYRGQVYVLEDFRGYTIRLRLPSNVFFHDGRLTGFVYDLPQPGLPLAYSSVSKQDPLARPALAIHYIDAKVKKLDPQNFSALIESCLKRRKQNGEIDQIKYQGLRHLALPARGVKLQGLYYRYRDILFKEQVGLWFFLETVSQELNLGYLLLEKLEESPPSAAGSPSQALQSVLKNLYIH